jgi:hypothetical protein
LIDYEEIFSRNESMTKSDKEHQRELEQQLNQFDPKVRRKALATLVGLAECGEIMIESVTDIANMHCHTFFSYNAYGYSPSGLAWLAKKKGYRLIGKVDFDVLDGVEEFLDACDLAGVRGSAAIESRVFFPEFSTRELNSPGEPGVYYHMGIGLTKDVAPEPGVAILLDMQERSASRNQEMIRRLNSFLDPLEISYRDDVLPLTPAGNATERHILAAYLGKVEEKERNPVQFWAGKLSLPEERVRELYQDPPVFQNKVRSTLMKRGGPGYMQPGSDSFPPLDQFHQAVTVCEGLICGAWLDGISAGEQAMQEQLDILVGKGAVALNIIPDRNWNISDSDVRRMKLTKLYEIVDLANQMDLPLNIGTEMNTFGQKLVDDFSAPELVPIRQFFMDGAYFIWGHTVMQRSLGLGYHSQWTRLNLHSRKAKNTFYTRLGKIVMPGLSGQKYLKDRVTKKGSTDLIIPDDFFFEHK